VGLCLPIGRLGTPFGRPRGPPRRSFGGASARAPCVSVASKVTPPCSGYAARRLARRTQRAVRVRGVRPRAARDARAAAPDDPAGDPRRGAGRGRRAQPAGHAADRPRRLLAGRPGRLRRRAAGRPAPGAPPRRPPRPGRRAPRPGRSALRPLGRPDAAAEPLGARDRRLGGQPDRRGESAALGQFPALRPAWPRGVGGPLRRPGLPRRWPGRGRRRRPQRPEQRPRPARPGRLDAPAGPSLATAHPHERDDAASYHALARGWRCAAARPRRSGWPSGGGAAGRTRRCGRAAQAGPSAACQRRAPAAGPAQHQPAARHADAARRSAARASGAGWRPGSARRLRRPGPERPGRPRRPAARRCGRRPA